MNRLKMFIISIVISLSGAASMGMAAAAPLSHLPRVVASNAQPSDLGGDACSGLGQLNGGSSSYTCGSNSSDGLNHLAHAIVEIISVIAGIIAIIMILIAGVKFMTSGGDSAKAGSARSTLAYAIIGLIVAVLAQLIARFALTVGNSAAKSGMMLEVFRLLHH